MMMLKALQREVNSTSQASTEFKSQMQVFVIQSSLTGVKGSDSRATN